jgi:uncharacterized membrane protein YozB (DUF420 family)
MDSFLSNAPDARLASDLTLLFFVVILAPAMLLGFSFARRKKFRPHHKYTMTAITLVIWLFILLLMIVSYRTWVAPAEVGGPFGGDPAHIIPTVHLITGGIAQILATYLVILMWTERTRFSWVVPKFLQTSNIKPIMRTTLTLWLVTIALGVGIFLTWYSPGGAAAPPPEATEEPVATEEPDVAETEEAEPVESAEPVETEEAD